MERRTWMSILLVVIILLGFIIFNDTRATQAAEKDSLGAVMKKLDKVIETQQEILKRFDAVMQELHIIKIRSTR